MTVADRVRICRLAQSIEKNKEYAEKIGVSVVNKKVETPICDKQKQYKAKEGVRYEN